MPDPGANAPVKVDGGTIDAAYVNAIRAAVIASLSEGQLAALIGDGNLASASGGAITPVTLTPATLASVADFIAGTDTGAKVWSAKHNADVGAWAAATAASGTLTVNFGTTLKRHFTPAANVTAWALTLDERFTGHLEVVMGATAYNFTFPVGWKVPQAVEDADGVWAPLANKTYDLIFTKRGTTISVRISEPLTPRT